MKKNTKRMGLAAASLFFAIGASASSVSLTPWGVEEGFDGGWEMRSESPLEFMAGGEKPAERDAVYRISFGGEPFEPGDTLTLTARIGFYDGSLGGTEFRFGLFDDRGQSGRLENGVWIDGNPLGYTGYLWTLPTGEEISDWENSRKGSVGFIDYSTRVWWSTNGEGHRVDVIDRTPPNRPRGVPSTDVLNGNYDLSLKLHYVSEHLMRIEYGFTQDGGYAYRFEDKVQHGRPPASLNTFALRLTGQNAMTLTGMSVSDLEISLSKAQ